MTLRAVLVLIVAALGVAACASQPGAGSDQRRAAAPAPTLVHTTNPKAYAEQLADRAVATAPRPAGARAVTTSPSKLIKEPPEIPSVTHLVQRTRFWVAPGSTAAVTTYLKAHPPKGMTNSGGGSSNGPDQPTVQFVDDETRAATPPELSVLYSVVAYRRGVAIRVDAQVIWVPNRPAWTFLPHSTSSVGVTVVRENPQFHQGAPTVRRTLTAQAAQSLASAANRLQEAEGGWFSCPMIPSGEKWSDTLTFHAGAQSWTVVDDLVGCSSVTIAQGKRTLALGGSIDPAVMKALGLPANYGGR